VALGTRTTSEEYDRVKLLFDYTKWHIGIYTTPRHLNCDGIRLGTIGIIRPSIMVESLVRWSCWDIRRDYSEYPAGMWHIGRVLPVTNRLLGTPSFVGADMD
jgi:hypothetical protein